MTSAFWKPPSIQKPRQYARAQFSDVSTPADSASNACVFHEHHENFGSFECERQIKTHQKRRVLNKRALVTTSALDVTVLIVDCHTR